MTKCEEAFDKLFDKSWDDISYRKSFNAAYRAGMERAAEIVWERRETPFDPYEAILKEMEE